MLELYDILCTPYIHTSIILLPIPVQYRYRYSGFLFEARELPVHASCCTGQGGGGEVECTEVLFPAIVGTINMI